MTEILDSAQMRAIEHAALAAGSVSGADLMERAGQGVVQALFATWPKLASGAHRAAVLCGPGNNGGDGFVVARLLHVAGWQVDVFLYGDESSLPPDARANLDRWCALGPVSPIDTLNARVEATPGLSFDVIVDALFGIGLRRAVPEVVADVFRNLVRGYLIGRVVAVDVPSGLCADSGRPLVPDGYPSESSPARDGWVVAADLTVTFHARKLGHVLADGPRQCGRVAVQDIGLPQDQDARTVTLCDFTGEGAAQGLAKGIEAHKFSYGHALILSGGAGRGGAARMAARGALRIGAGLVTVGCPPEALTENAARLDAVMLRLVEDASALAEVLKDARINALCLGPGLGVARAAQLLTTALPGRAVRAEHAHYGHRKLVIDADALTALAADAALFARLHPGCVLTPHGGEFVRLFPDIAERLEAPACQGPAFSKVDATREAAVRADCVVVFKGPDTVIADASGQCSIHSAEQGRAAPWLATAGSGDVLAGFVTGLLARGFGPMDAAEQAVWLHVECARAFGPGLIAEDLPEALPGVFRALGL